jgi:PTH1 family peptidyl-tRNA hydrolase
MNTSGEPVASLAKYYGIEPQNVIALHDDVDLPFDSIRTKIGGGEGGHNGLRSMTKSLGTKDYYRVRLGVGRPPGRQDTADFVLGRFTKAELQLLPAFIDDAVDATMMLLTEGLLATQQRFHSKQDG